MLPGGKLATPEPPKGILKNNKDSWVAFWDSELGQSPAIRRDTDLGVIERLWQLYDERDRAYQGYRRSRLVTGSQGQLVLNPLGRMYLDLEGKIQALEDRIGLSPMARLKLGITFGQAHASLDDLNRRMNEDSDRDQDPRDQDPRIIEASSS